MINRKNTVLLLVSMLAAVFMLNGCKANKQVLDALAKVEARLDVLEKIVLPPKEEDEKQKEAYVLPVGDSFVLGNPAAPHTITVFSNFQCPYCAEADKALRGLLNNAELKDTVKLVFKHFPFERHVNARPASKIAMAAGEQGNDKFWAMVEHIFGQQDKLKDLNDALTEKFAKDIGLDVAKFKADLKQNDAKYDERINADVKLGAEAAHLKGTPWILVDGILLDGNIDAATIKKMIAEKK